MQILLKYKNILVQALQGFGYRNKETGDRSRKAEGGYNMNQNLNDERGEGLILNQLKLIPV